MRTVYLLASFAGLGLTVVPAFLVWSGHLSFSTHAVLMAVGTVLWFATAPAWMHDKRKPA